MSLFHASYSPVQWQWKSAIIVYFILLFDLQLYCNVEQFQSFCCGSVHEGKIRYRNNSCSLKLKSVSSLQRNALITSDWPCISFLVEANLHKDDRTVGANAVLAKSTLVRHASKLLLLIIMSGLNYRVPKVVLYYVVI